MASLNGIMVVGGLGRDKIDGSGLDPKIALSIVLFFTVFFTICGIFVYHNDRSK